MLTHASLEGSLSHRSFEARNARFRTTFAQFSPASRLTVNSRGTSGPHR